MQQRRKRSKGEPNLKSKAACWRATGEPVHHQKANWRASGLPSLESRQWLANRRATGENTSQLRVLLEFSAYKKGKWGIFRGGWKNTIWGTSRALLGGLKSLKNLGISWESSGETWRDLGIPHLWLYLSPYSSPLFNALFHSFRVCFICIYV